MRLPPTISRSLVNPYIAEVFAICMIVGALFLTVGAVQIAIGFTGLIRRIAPHNKQDWLLLFLFIIAEVPALSGMIVLSQFTGRTNPGYHDLGSYMLFFGHTTAIVTLGCLVTRLAGQAATNGKPAMLDLRWVPRHAKWVAFFAVVFGVAYFFGKFETDVLPFWQHMILSLTEMVVLLAFLSFYGRCWKFLAHRS